MHAKNVMETDEINQLKSPIIECCVYFCWVYNNAFVTLVQCRHWYYMAIVYEISREQNLNYILSSWGLPSYSYIYAKSLILQKILIRSGLWLSFFLSQWKLHMESSDVSEHTNITNIIVWWMFPWLALLGAVVWCMSYC